MAKTAKTIRIPDTALRAAGLAPRPNTALIVAGLAAPFGDVQADLLRRLSAVPSAVPSAPKPDRPRKR